MTFAQPLWMIAGGFVCLALFLLIRRLESRRRVAMETFAAAKLLGRLSRNVSVPQRRLKKTLLLLAIFCLFVALARPQYGFRWVEVKRKGIDILFALDTSNSMLASDIRPNRLERSKLAIMDFVSQLKGDRVGLMPFAGSAFLLCPLTLDYSAFEQSLITVDTTIIPKGGTNISNGISEAEYVLSNEANHKILILITDGENLEGDAVARAKTAAENKMTIHTVGVGTRDGELVPVSTNGGSRFIKDDSGKFVQSRLDEATLQQLAEVSGGLYVPLGASGEGLETLYQQTLSLIPKEELAERQQKVPLERFQYPLALALFLLTLEFLISGRKSSQKRTLPFITTAGRRVRGKVIKSGLLLCLLAGLSSPPPAEATGGEEAFRQEKFIEASQLYSKELQKRPDDPLLHYNYGTTAYKNTLYNDAITSFTKALQSDDLTLQQRAYYNRGNAHYRQGEETIQTAPQQTITQWQKALESYKSSLALQPDDKDSRYNLELTEKKLQQLQQQLQQQQQNNDKRQQEDQNNNQQQEGEQQEQGDNQQQDATGQSPKKSEEPGEDTPHQQKSKPETPPAAGENKTPQQTTTPQSQKTEQRQQAAQQNERRRQGKMSKEEAEHLLNGLKGDEERLNFIPAGSRNDTPPRRNW